jgi:hypothetical protein
VVTLNSKNYQDSRGQVDRLDFPYRSTIIFKNHVWEIVEVAERSDKEGEIEECQGEPTTESLSLQERWKTCSTWGQSTFLRPKSPVPTEEKKQKQGFGWHGKTLEDGVY